MLRGGRAGHVKSAGGGQTGAKRKHKCIHSVYMTSLLLQCVLRKHKLKYGQE
jgi:hypothetical protein